MTQILKLADTWNGYESIYVTTTEAPRGKLSKMGRVYNVGECNHQHPIRVLKVLLWSIIVVLKEKPDVVISTGAAAGCMVCFLAKAIGAKVVWIDSITNVRRLSFSGRMVRHIANLFFVQWPELAERYKNAEYYGSVI